MGAWSPPVLRLHEAGVTLARLAQHSGISRVMLELYCRGAYEPPERFYEAIADLAGPETAAAVREHLEAAA